jgi:DNA primase
MIDLNKLIELISNTESLSRIFETNLEEIKPHYWKGKSPFKSENTPSFFVSKDKTIMYKCFATQKGRRFL